MKFRHELSYDAPSSEVYAMLADPAFREKVAAAQHATDWDVAIDSAGAGMTVAVDQHRPADGIPGFARKIVGDSIHIAQRERWHDAGNAELEVTIPHKPGHLVGSITLVESGGRSVETVSGDVKVSVPLIAGKLEGLISELLESALRTEQRIGTAWLAGDR